MLHVQFVTGILLIFAKQETVKQYFLLKQLYEIGPSGPNMSPTENCRSQSMLHCQVIAKYQN